MKLLKQGLLAIPLLATMLATSASAAVITLNESGLDAVYGQAGIDIRFNPSQTIFNSALLVIDDDIEFNALSAYETGGNTLSMFFLNGINFCGSAIPGIVGCGSTPGTLIALDSPSSSVRMPRSPQQRMKLGITSVWITFCPMTAQT